VPIIHIYYNIRAKKGNIGAKLEYINALLLGACLFLAKKLVLIWLIENTAPPVAVRNISVRQDVLLPSNRVIFLLALTVLHVFIRPTKIRSYNILDIWDGR
jgi:hypothetical protein